MKYHCTYFNVALPTETKRKISISLFFSKQFLQHNLWLQVKDINARLERIQPQIRSSDGLPNTFAALEIKTASFNPKKSSPKAKSSTRETSLFGGWHWFNSNTLMLFSNSLNFVNKVPGFSSILLWQILTERFNKCFQLIYLLCYNISEICDGLLGDTFLLLFSSGEDITEKLIEPIKVYSEKELIREFEKIGSTLVPDKDWSVRIAAMQRVEGLVLGGLWPLCSICLC